LVDYDQLNIADSVVELKKVLGKARRVSSELLATVEQTQDDIRSSITPKSKLAIDPTMLSGINSLRNKLKALEALDHHSTLCSDNHQFIKDLCDLCNKEMHVVDSLYKAVADGTGFDYLIKLMESTKRDVMASANKVRQLEERIAMCQKKLLYKNGSYGVGPISGDTSPSNRMTEDQRIAF
jgi:hypothetical protein